MTTTQPPYSLVWPVGADPRKDYPLCPVCGHDFGSDHGGKDPDGWCWKCDNNGTPCKAIAGAVFDAIEAARAAMEPEDELQPVIDENMKDPAFAYAYGRAEGFYEALRLPLWRRVTRRAWLPAQDGGQADG